MSTSPRQSQTIHDTLSRLQTRYIQAVAGGALFLSLVGLIVTIISLLEGNEDVGRALFTQLLMFCFAAVILALIWRGRSQLAGLILVIFMTGITIVLADVSSFLITGTLAVISVATLGSTLIYWGANLLLAARVAHVIYLIETQPGAEALAMESEAANLLMIAATIAIISLATRYFIRAAENAAQNARRSSDLLQASAEVGTVTANILDLDELLPRAVDLIRDRFAFYHVQVFLIDEQSEYANLVASTGNAGLRLLERQHRLRVSSQSVIGRVTQIGEPVIAVMDDPVHAQNELLPNTQSELALPIFDGDIIIGALDVQSTRPNAFTSIDIQALQVMANQLGTSIRNARLFKNQTRSVQENKRLFLESESNLREIQRLNQELTRSAWMTYLKPDRIKSGITVTDDNSSTDAVWTETMTQASERRRPVSQSYAGRPVVAVPIMIKGEVLGAIEVEANEIARDSDVVEMVQAVAERLAASLDRARLFEDVQASSSQQQYINQVVARYQSADTVDDLLRITLAELSETLGAEQAAIRLGFVQQQDTSGEQVS
jgi:GAF domain-containing protein